ncbi:hypothetical protein CTI14_51410 [Methylobacterium radiotolerans]|nr:hypothetical protein CTI14_51410 [Methylobacterium radiotolerans]
MEDIKRAATAQQGLTYATAGTGSIRIWQASSSRAQPDGYTLLMGTPILRPTACCTQAALRRD